jgi:23S rRNA pseudouridine1911/1915/1917 synthase
MLNHAGRLIPVIFAKNKQVMLSEKEWENEPEDDDSSESRYERMAFTVDKGQESIRIDKFLINRMEGGTRNKLQQGIEKGFVLVNNQVVKSNYKIRPGDHIIMYSDTAPELTEVIPEQLPLDIRYEDDDIIILYKPAGMVVHPGSGNYTGTVVNGISWYLKQQQPHLSESELPRFGLVHRIDKNTTGLLVLAKNEIASVRLASQFAEHTVQRRYIALVWGDFTDDSGTIVAHVGRHQRHRKIMDTFPEGEYGKEAITHYRVLERLGYVSLIECRLETGRTHQIRVHMKYIGHPLFNDETYGGDKIVKGTVFTKYKQFVENCFALCPRHALHAKTLGFIHPTSGKQMLFESEIPADMQSVIEKWRRYVGAKGMNVE